MPSLGIIAHNNGMILRAYKSDEEEAAYAVLGPIPNSQPKVMVDLENNRVFEELINVNELHRWRLNAGLFTRDGAIVNVHPASEAEATRLALPNIVQALKDFRQLGVLAPTATVVEIRSRVIEMQEAVDNLINAFQYIAKNHLKIVP